MERERQWHDLKKIMREREERERRDEQKIPCHITLAKTMTAAGTKECSYY
jgi:hypothetical protein